VLDEQVQGTDEERQQDFLLAGNVVIQAGFL